MQAATLAAALTTWLTPPPSQDPHPTAPFPRSGDTVGKAVCKDCHEEQWNAITGGVHAAVVREDAMLGCELCHGPGKAHAEHVDNDPALITHPRQLAPAAQDQVCGQCHRDQMAAHGGDPAGFVAAGKGCTSCHTVHIVTPPTAHPGVHFTTRVQADHTTAPVGAERCITCHPLQHQRLAASAHRRLAAEDPNSCERCHGAGALHAESQGIGRLITRADTADDGIATCRSCHEHVDAVDFHWRDKKKPLLSAGMRCTTCHRVHQEAEPPPPEPVDASTGETATATVTNALCARCHEPAFAVLEGTIHQQLGRRDAPLQQGCGGCHAGALTHARRGGQRRWVDSLRGSDAAHQLATCGQCHGGEEKLAHVRAGSHQRREVTCLTCHSPAAPAADVRGDAEKRCAQCHQNVAAEFRQPNHHPVPEGHMGCSDCHNAHSARPKIRDREVREQSCVRCHAQYRGPFVFAHQASRTDGCVICHSPHGASNRRLLRQHTTQQNCLQCHGDFPAFHDQTSGAVFTNCLNCHTEVHGSNHARYLFR